MSNSSEQEPRPSRKRILDSDEKIAILIAFTVIGSLLFWLLGIPKGKYAWDSKKNNISSLLKSSISQPSNLSPSSSNLDTLETESSTLTPSDSNDSVDSDSQQKQPKSLPTPDTDRNNISSDRSRSKDKMDLSNRSTRSPVYQQPVVVIPSKPETPDRLSEKPAPLETPKTTSPFQPTPDQLSEKPETTETKPSSIPANTFKDVPEEYWASAFIEPLYKKNLIEGISPDNFVPDRPITRAEMAKIVNKAFGDIQPMLDTKQFNDLTSQDRETIASINQVVKMGFMKGYAEGDFRPDEPISRYQMLVALATGLNLEPSKNPAQILKVYQDADRIPTWAKNQVAAATEKGLTVNYPNLNTLDPNRSATRAEVAASIYQALAELGKVEKVPSQYIVPSP